MIWQWKDQEEHLWKEYSPKKDKRSDFISRQVLDEDDEDMKLKEEEVRMKRKQEKGNSNEGKKGSKNFKEKRDFNQNDCTAAQQFLSSFTNIECSRETSSPISNPSTSPTIIPSVLPSHIASQIPSTSPSKILSQSPSSSPSTFSSTVPSVHPSMSPTFAPSSVPTDFPSLLPSLIPTGLPTIQPTVSSQPSLNPSMYPSLFPSLNPTVLPSTNPSLSPTSTPSLVPTVESSILPTIEPSAFPSIVPTMSPSFTPSISLIPSGSPSRFPQNTCFFTEGLRIDTACNDHITSDSSEKDRTLYADEFICSQNRRYRFGMTVDKFLCLCDGDRKIWCASNCCSNRRDPYVKLRRNGCLTAYADRFIGKSKIWASNPEADDATTGSNDDKGIFLHRETKRLQLRNDGRLQILNHLDPTVLSWEANLDVYVPYHPPTPAPTISISPSIQPTKSPAPSISPAPSSNPIFLTNEPSVQATFSAGMLVDKPLLGMRVSRGLSVRIIGETGKRARYDNGGFSSIPVHDQPDAGGCFDQPDGGWIYVSNSELREGGGVGAFQFSPQGQLISYKMVQKNSKMNCGGGISPWGTWFSGEEFSGNPEGGMWEVDVNGGGARMTNFGRGKFESAVCDDRDMIKLKCFATIDEENGSLRRYQPNFRVLQDAVTAGDFSNVLHAPGGILTYLLLKPNLGQYSWTTNKSNADKNAQSFYPNLEGIDQHDGKLYFVSKVKKQLFVLNLDSNTYEVSSTESGSFKHQPDQIKHLIGDDPNGSAYLYFLEDGGDEPGIYARNLKSNKAFTVVEKIVDQFNGDEATGLAFCDNFRRMIFAFQERGTIYEVTRDDGLPFYGATANVKYHSAKLSRGDMKRSSINHLRASEDMPTTG